MCFSVIFHREVEDPCADRAYAINLELPETLGRGFVRVTLYLFIYLFIYLFLFFWSLLVAGYYGFTLEVRVSVRPSVVCPSGRLLFPAVSGTSNAGSIAKNILYRPHGTKIHEFRYHKSSPQRLPGVKQWTIFQNPQFAYIWYWFSPPSG